MKGRALIVEDDSVLLDILAETFQDRGFSVHPAASGDEALAVLEIEGFSVIVTDLVMEGADGLAVLEKARERNPEAAAVLLTGYGDMTSAVRALRLGADDYILKPVSALGLADRVEDILAKKEKRIQEILAGFSLFCCARCGRVREPSGSWETLEEFLESRRQGGQVHSVLCPDCSKKGPGGE